MKDDNYKNDPTVDTTQDNDPPGTEVLEVECDHCPSRKLSSKMAAKTLILLSTKTISWIWKPTSILPGKQPTVYFREKTGS